MDVKNRFVSTVSRQLTAYYGKGFSDKNLRRMILCTGKNHECIELLELGKSGIHVAEYLTALPSKEALVQKLQQASRQARQRLEHQSKE